MPKRNNHDSQTNNMEALKKKKKANAKQQTKDGQRPGMQGEKTKNKNKKTYFRSIKLLLWHDLDGHILVRDQIMGFIDDRECTITHLLYESVSVRDAGIRWKLWALPLLFLHHLRQNCFIKLFLLLSGGGGCSRGSSVGDLSVPVCVDGCGFDGHITRSRSRFAGRWRQCRRHDLCLLLIQAARGGRSSIVLVGLLAISNEILEILTTKRMLVLIILQVFGKVLLTSNMVVANLADRRYREFKYQCRLASACSKAKYLTVIVIVKK